MDETPAQASHTPPDPSDTPIGNDTTQPDPFVPAPLTPYTFIIMVIVVVASYYFIKGQIKKQVLPPATIEEVQEQAINPEAENLPFGSFTREDGSIGHAAYHLCGARDCFFAEEFKVIQVNGDNCLSAGSGRIIMCGTYAVHDLRPRE